MDSSTNLWFLSAFLFCAICISSAATEFLASKPMGKTWWAKRVSESLFVAGRLSDIQIKYASEDGFRSIVSVYNHTEAGKFGSKVLPPTAEAKDIAERLSGLEFAVLCDGDSHKEDEAADACWQSKEAVKRFDNLYKSLEKPILLYSNTGYSAAFIALSWLVWQTHLGNVEDVNYQTSAEYFYKRASVLGYDFSEEEDLKQIVRELSGGQKVENPAKPNLAIPDWHKHYWWAKPVEENWYVAGQIWSDHIDLINNLGVDVLINSRMGATFVDPDSGEATPSQEEVTLLNVNEDCWTYCPGGRQSTTQLKANRIDPMKPAEYICPENPEDENYMSRNPLEFGDDVGYNETIEELEMKEVPLEYIHTPLESCDETMYAHYEKTWKEAHKKGNVLMHCRTGCRAVVPTLWTAGQLLGKDMDWAIETGRLIGYDFTEDDDPDVWDLFKETFKSSQNKPKTEL